MGDHHGCVVPDLAAGNVIRMVMGIDHVTAFLPEPGANLVLQPDRGRRIDRVSCDHPGIGD